MRPGLDRSRLLVLALANGLGLLAFAWPFVLPALGLTASNRMNAPLILIFLVACLGALLFLELGRGGLGPKTVALLGILGAAMVALRLPGFILGFAPLFIIVLVGGNAFGPGFGFLLGAVGMLASGMFVGGLGPWLPFEMVAVGWVGLGAGLLPGASTRSWTVRVGVLAAYGFAVGLLYGAVMDLWEWPFTAAGSAIAWSAAASPAVNFHHFMKDYVVTSLPWDLPRAFGNLLMVLILGRPLLGALDRAARGMRLDVKPVLPDTAPAS